MIIRTRTSQVGIIFLITLFAIAFAGCGTRNNKNTNLEDTITIKSDSAMNDKLSKAKQVFYSLPSPIELVMLLKTAKVKYNEKLMNKVSNSSKYLTDKSMALNLGIYSADLSYASLYDQTQTSIQYLLATKKIAENLNIINAFSDKTISRIENNISNRDSILSIVSESFMNAHAYLSENNRLPVSAIIITGGWIEGLYFSTQLAKNSNFLNAVLAERVSDQKMSLDLLINLLDQYKSNQDVNSIAEDILKLKVLFDKIPAPSGKAVVVSTDKKTNKQAEAQSSIPISLFKEITTLVESIRNKYIL